MKVQVDSVLYNHAHFWGVRRCLLAFPSLLFLTRLAADLNNKIIILFLPAVNIRNVTCHSYALTIFVSNKRNISQLQHSFTLPSVPVYVEKIQIKKNIARSAGSPWAEIFILRANDIRFFKKKERKKKKEKRNKIQRSKELWEELKSYGTPFSPKLLFII